MGAGRNERTQSYPGLWNVRGLREGPARAPAGDRAAGPSTRNSRPPRASPDQPAVERPQASGAAKFRGTTPHSPHPGGPLVCAGRPSPPQLSPRFLEPCPSSRPQLILPAGRPRPRRGPSAAARSQPARFPSPDTAGSAFSSRPQRGRSRNPGCGLLSGNNPFGPGK